MSPYQWRPVPRGWHRASAGEHTDAKHLRSLNHPGVRVPIVAMKPGNAGGAKGYRKVNEEGQD